MRAQVSLPVPGRSAARLLPRCVGLLLVAAQLGCPGVPRSAGLGAPLAESRTEGSPTGSSAQQLRELRAQLDQQRQQLQRMESEINDGLSLALCRPELRQLLEDVQRECQTPTSGDDPVLCTTKQIRPAVIAADPEHRGRFLKMMSSLRHEVVYVPRGRSAVVRNREERLHRLAQQVLLRTTLFLVVSHSESGVDEAVRRAEFIEGLLTKEGVPRERLRRWIYSFPANRTDIERPTDRPGPGEPEDLTRGVWVFRADC